MNLTFLPRDIFRDQGVRDFKTKRKGNSRTIKSKTIKKAQLY